MIGVPDEAGGGLLFVSVLVFVLLGAATGTAAAQSAPDCSTVSYDGAGTDANPYEVSNVDQLQCIEEQDLDASYELVSDIDASETASWNDGKGFDPIEEFTGELDGKRHSITDLTIDRDSEDDVGLFGVVGSGGTIRNVSLVNAEINANKYVGSLVGINAGTVNRSYANGSVNGYRFVGGLVGWNFITVETSHAAVSVNGSLVVGGLVGENGMAFSRGTVSESYASGSVNGSETVGGLVGINRNGTVSESYASGSVDGYEGVGGLVGVHDYSIVSGSYWDVQATGQSTSSGETGLTTAEMTGSAARGNMTAFDFTSTWKTVPDDYPILAWQDERRGEGNGDISDGSNEGGNGSSVGDDGGSRTEGLPGFTVVTAVLALLTIAAAAVRRRAE